MIVPIEAWEKMLIQLGNLHEAGQQLAEARERAAKAETEAGFLRERLAELRTSPAQAPQPEASGDAATEAAPPHDAPPVAPSATAAGPNETLWQFAIRRWQQRSRLRP